jgi:15-hydroxyprostaglandin dehydrogenase (NAD)
MSSTSPMNVKTAVITGACSGMGKALTYNLLAKTSPQWRVVMADINAPAYEAMASTLDPTRHIFVRTDVSNWVDQLAVFKQAYSWSNGRIDFFAANAGIADKEALLQPFDLDADPAKPNLNCIEVDLLGIFYGLKLFIHFARKTRRDLTRTISSTPFNPKMVITASMAGQYPFFTSPQYAAAKHGCVGLVRSAAPALLKHENIALNCVMPAFVDTNIMPEGLVAKWPKEHITPLPTIMRAFNELIDESGRIEADGKSQGEDGVVKSGCAVECVIDELFYRDPVQYANASQEWVTDQAREEGIIGRALKEAMAMRRGTPVGKTT